MCHLLIVYCLACYTEFHKPQSTSLKPACCELVIKLQDSHSYMHLYMILAGLEVIESKYNTCAWKKLKGLSNSKMVAIDNVQQIVTNHQIGNCLDITVLTQQNHNLHGHYSNRTINCPCNAVDCFLIFPSNYNNCKLCCYRHNNTYTWVLQTDTRETVACLRVHDVILTTPISYASKRR